MIFVHIQGKPFNITVIQVYASTTNSKEAEVEQFCDDQQDLLELTHTHTHTHTHTQILFIIAGWNVKVGSQEIPGVIGKFGLGKQNEAGQRLTVFQQHKRRLYTWTSPDGQHQNQIDYIICSQTWSSSI